MGKLWTFGHVLCKALVCLVSHNKQKREFSVSEQTDSGEQITGQVRPIMICNVEIFEIIANTHKERL